MLVAGKLLVYDILTMEAANSQGVVEVAVAVVVSPSTCLATWRLLPVINVVAANWWAGKMT